MDRSEEATVKVQTTRGEACEFVTPGSLAPCMLVIFGASGDLAARKLIPAFYSLYLTNSLPEPFGVVGSSRTNLSHDEFRDKMKQAIAKEGRLDLGRWDGFAAKLFYQRSHNICNNNITRRALLRKHRR